MNTPTTIFALLINIGKIFTVLNIKVTLRKINARNK